MACAAAIVLTLGVSLASTSPRRAQSPGPAVPYEDIGACPFECCAYREWTAAARVTLLRDRRPDSGTAFVAEPGERVRAITGLVITTVPARAQVDRQADVWTTEGDLRLTPGDELYLLTPQGEGHFAAWFKGRLFDSLDATGIAGINGACAVRPERCHARVVDTQTIEWWVRVRSLRGVTGWTREPEKFSNKGRCS